MERVYVATRIEAGLYLQPSNDGERIFVIASYEDGRAHGLEHGPNLATFWAWGPITVEEIKGIERSAAFGADLAIQDLRQKALGHHDGYRTKREATDAALSSTQSAHDLSGSTA
jgi:hypothetical protein